MVEKEEDIKGDADILGMQLLTPVLIIVGVLTVSTLIYCIAQCVKSRRMLSSVAVIHGKGNLDLVEFAKRRETETNNLSLEHSYSSSSQSDRDSNRIKKVGCYP